MTIENWLTIALIISALIAPVIGAYVQPLISQPTPAPEANQPKKRTHNISERVIQFSQSPWYVPGFIVVFNIYGLYVDFSKAGPITHWTIFEISMSVAGIWLGLVLMMVNRNRQSTREAFDMILPTLGKLTDAFHTVNGFVGTLSKDVKDMKATLQYSDLVKQLQDMTRQLQNLQAKIGQQPKGFKGHR